jgi:hypothetical protein
LLDHAEFNYFLQPFADLCQEFTSDCELGSSSPEDSNSKREDLEGLVGFQGAGSPAILEPPRLSWASSKGRGRHHHLRQ